MIESILLILSWIICIIIGYIICSENHQKKLETPKITTRKRIKKEIKECEKIIKESDNDNINSYLGDDMRMKKKDLIKELKELEGEEING